jgi:hypothetical protein
MLGHGRTTGQAQCGDRFPDDVLNGVGCKRRHSTRPIPSMARMSGAAPGMDLSCRGCSLSLIPMADA